MVSVARAVFQVQVSALLYHQPAGERETDAAARALGGEERHEDVLPRLGGYGLSVVADVEGVCALLHGDACGSCLDGVFDEVDEYLAQHIAVYADNDIVSHLSVPGDLGI